MASATVRDVSRQDATPVAHEDKPSTTSDELRQTAPTDLDQTRPVATGRDEQPPREAENGAAQMPEQRQGNGSDLDIYEHPYVKKLEQRNEQLMDLYLDQVRRTEDIQLKSQERLVELQRMTTIGQSKTLADFMLNAKQWLTRADPTEAPREGGEPAMQ